MLSNKVDPKNKKPLYLQLKDIFIDRIQRGIWEHGTLIPTEQELIKEFNVSRTTVRQAVSILVEDGLLEKKQGRGTTVCTSRLIGNLKNLRGFAEEVIERGLTPKSKLLRVEFRNNLFQEKEILGVQEDNSILLIERIRFANDTPIAIEHTCWPQEIGNILVQYDLNKAHYYEILEQYNIYLKNAKETIKAINATIEEADYLGIRPGEALLEMTRLSFGLNDHPIEYTKTKYRSDEYCYSIELKR